MSTASVQHCLARLLVSAADRRELRADPTAVGRRFGLEPEELATVAAIDPDRLEFTAGGVIRARLRTLRRMFRATGAIGDRGWLDRELDAFIESDIPLAAAEDSERWLAEGQRFVAWLRAREDAYRAPHLVELARLELLRAELLYRPAAERASAAADLAAGLVAQLDDVALLTGSAVSLGAHVRLARFEYDVLSMRAGDPPPARADTRLALARRAGRASVAAHRLDGGTFAVVEALAGGRGPAGADAASALRDVAALGLLTITDLPGTGDRRAAAPAPRRSRVPSMSEGR